MRVSIPFDTSTALDPSKSVSPKPILPIVSYDDGRVAYGITATAKLLGVSRQHVSALIRRGDIRAVTLGRRVLIPAAEINRLLGIEEGTQ